MEEFYVEIVWQVANLNECNMLDIGAWMVVQSEVERIHRLLVMWTDVLAETIELAFDILEEEVLFNIHRRWLKVLKLIIKGKGNNQLVEKSRNKYDKENDLVSVDEGKIDMPLVVEEESSDEEISIDLDVDEADNENNDN